MERNSQKLDWVLRWADSHLVLGQRVAEWCGHGPVLEQDIALANVALDLLGQARNLYQYASELDPEGRNEDQLAFTRDSQDYKNYLITELPNGDFAQTVLRQFFFDAFVIDYFHALASDSQDETIAAIAEKSLKEVRYHYKYSSEWCIRLGDGTEESHRRMNDALEYLWPYTGEMFELPKSDMQLIEQSLIVDSSAMKDSWDAKVKSVLGEAKLEIPEIPYMQSGGISGSHTEHMGHLLSDMQYMQRTYPNLEW